MKKRMMALAVTAAITAPLAAQADVTVYGKVHLNAGTYEEIVAGVTTEDNFQFTSFDSRLGVKGEHDLGDGLMGTYRLEFGVNPDSNTNTGFSRRNMWAGLKGSFGEMRFGRHDTPLKMVQGKFDQFGDTRGDLKHAGDEDGEHRFDNVMAYLGKAGNLSYAIALIPGEGDGVTAGDGVADSTSISVAYKAGPLYIGAATDSYDDTGAAPGTSNSLTRLVTTYKFGGSQLGLLWQSGVEKVTASTDEEDWLGISFNTKLGGKNKFKAQYITVEDNQATPVEGTLMSIGMDHKFGKKVSGYVMYSTLEEEQGGTTNLEEKSLSVGYVVKF